jgi:DNA-binding IscR family transcriptional regulator
MTLDDLVREAHRAGVLAVLRQIDDCIRAVPCDSGAIAPEHALGYAAGFKAAKSKIRDALAENVQ